MTATAASEERVRAADGTPLGVWALGSGPSLIVLGGALRTAVDYLPLARALASEFRVHVVDRRGRGSSGPQDADYALATECEDLLAVQAATGARRVFGHSYAGVIVLETAARAAVFERIAVYEPGLPIAGAIPLDWMARYRALLSAGDRRGAFAWFVRQSGHAPGPVGRLPFWYLRAVLRLVLSGERWQRFDALLETNLTEHEQLATLHVDLERYSRIDADVLLMRGSRSPRAIVAEPLSALERTLPRGRVEVLDGLDHNAPDEKAPESVAAAVRDFMSSDRPPS